MSSFTTDISITKPYPGILLTGTEITPHPYFEDREVNGTFYRTVNAVYNDTGVSPPYWSHFNPGPSYAFAEKADGTIAFFAVPASTSSWTTWGGNNDRGIYNAVDFGADPTGISYSQGAISKASAAASAAGGGIVLLPPGTYVINEPIDLSSNTVLKGSGVDVTIITAAAGVTDPNNSNQPTADVVRNHGLSVPLPEPTDSNIGVRDLTINGNAPGNGGAFAGDAGAASVGGASIHMQKVVGVTVHNCRIYNCPNHAIIVDGGAEGTTLQGPVRVLNNTIDIMATRGMVSGKQNALLTGNLSIRVQAIVNGLISGNIIGYNPNLTAVPGWVTTWSNDGIDTPSSTDVTVVNNQMQYVTDGIGVAGGSKYVIANNIVEHFLGFGIRSLISTLLPNGVQNLTISNNVVIAEPYSSNAPQLPSAAGIHVEATTQPGPPTGPTAFFTVANNVVIGPFSTSGACISFGGNQGCCIGNAVDINHYAVSGGGSTPSQQGIAIYGNDVTVTGNYVYDSQTVAGVTTYGFLFDNSGSSTQQQNITLDSNVVDAGTDCTGIYITNNISTTTITNNNLVGNGTSLVIASGVTLTEVRIAGNLGYTPLPTLTSPPPSIGSAQTNTYAFDCTVYIANATGVTVNEKTSV